PAERGRRARCSARSGPHRLASDDPYSGGGIAFAANPLVNWNYYTDAEEGVAHTSLHWPRGRVIGGTRSDKGVAYVRGNPADYDGWAQMGCRGWSYSDVLPYFRKSEHYVSGSSEYRGKGVHCSSRTTGQFSR